jgi:pyruvate dehydrogenase E1 component alpha subunit
MGTHIARGTAMANDLKAKAEAFGMRYAECDGLDVLDVYDCFTEQVEMTRNAKNPQWERGGWDQITYDREGATPGPAFINVKTYRYQGHSMSDPQKYRTKDEVGEFKERDCINMLVNRLIEDGKATQEQCDELDSKAKEAAKVAIQFAEDSPEMPVEEMFTDVYANPFGPYKKGGLPNIVTNENSGE